MSAPSPALCGYNAARAAAIPPRRGEALARYGLKVTLRPGVLRWARERVGYDADALAAKLNVAPHRVAEWEETGRITMAQARNLARHTHTPEGYLYLEKPPDDRLPIADLRTPDGQPPQRPSPNLLDTVYLMQARQEWLREERIIEEAEPLPFVRSFPNGAKPEEVADGMREALGVEVGWASDSPTWSEALRYLRDRIEQAGALVFFNGIVDNNTHRKLDRAEFQGFALMDDYAPLIFVNGADYKAAQMFTLAHELAHLFVGVDGVSNLDHDAHDPPPRAVERRCNSIAAEFLVESGRLRKSWSAVGDRPDAFQRLAKEFKVSEIVAAIKALDLELITRSRYSEFYDDYAARVRRQAEQQRGGGDFWNNQNVRVGRIFGAAVVRAVYEGRLLYREAYMLTGLKGETFDKFARWTGALS